MNCPEETRQQLWDLIYGLLAPEEAQSLSARITADPQVARAYAEAKLRADLLAVAAKLEEARLPLAMLGDGEDGFDLDSEKSAKERAAPARSWSAAQVVNLLAGLAALALLAFAGIGYAQYTWGGAALASKVGRKDLARKFVQIVVAGPEVVNPAETNYFSVNTFSLDGTQVSTDVNGSVLTNGVVKHDLKGWSDANGAWNFEVPGKFLKDQATVRFEAEGEDFAVSLAADDWSSSAASNESPPGTDGTNWYLATAEVDALRPLELQVRSPKYGNLVVSAENGGRQVGQQMITPPANDSTEHSQTSFRLLLAIDPKVSGATRVTLYDYGVNPPATVSERFFHVLPTKKLSIDRTDPVDVYAPGDEVQLQFQVLDSEEKPVSANLSVAVVDETVLLAHNGRTKAAESQILLAYDNDVKDNALSSTAENILVLSDATSASPLPKVRDNSSDVQDAYQKEVEQFDQRHVAGLQRVGQITLAGGAILIVGLLSLAVLHRTGARMWLSSLAAAGLCTLLGVLWMTARVDERGQIALAPYTSSNDQLRSPGESHVAQNQSSPDKDSQVGKSENKPATSGEGVAATPGQAGSRVAGSGGGSPEGGKRFGGDYFGLPVASTARPPSTAPTSGGQVGSFSRDLPVYFANPQLTAGDDGRATVNFKLPPKSGVYRVFVEGRSGESLGLYRGKIVSRQSPAASEAK